MMLKMVEEIELRLINKANKKIYFINKLHNITIENKSIKKIKVPTL